MQIRINNSRNEMHKIATPSKRSFPALNLTSILWIRCEYVIIPKLSLCWRTAPIFDYFMSDYSRLYIVELRKAKKLLIRPRSWDQNRKNIPMFCALRTSTLQRVFLRRTSEIAKQQDFVAYVCIYAKKTTGWPLSGNFLLSLWMQLLVCYCLSNLHYCSQKISILFRLGIISVTGVRTVYE